jgi:hypothetical protein
MTQAPVAANNKPENITNTPPVMYNASILYSPPTLGQVWGWLAYYEPECIDGLLKEIGTRTAELALESFEIAIKAMGTHEPGPEERLELYRVKPPELWMEQQAKFPWRYEHDMLDWMSLEQRYPLRQEEPTLPEITDDYEPPQEPRPKKKIRKAIRNEQGRIDRVEEYEE